MKDQNRWRSHPKLGHTVTVAAVIAPFALSFGVSMVMGRVLPHGHGVPGRLVWWLAVLGPTTVVFALSQRACRRLFPLAALLKMTMLFPDQAPKRLKVAWRAGLTRDLARQARGESNARPSVPAAVAEDVLALAASLSRHDRRTRGHSERVRALTDMIAEELRLARDERDKLRWSALLHDVGKLTVHPDILNKPGKPTELEWEQIRNHPLEGRRFVDQCSKHDIPPAVGGDLTTSRGTF